MTSTEAQDLLTLWARISKPDAVSLPSGLSQKQLSEACRTAVAIIQRYERMIPEQRIRGAIRNLTETQEYLTALVTP